MDFMLTENQKRIVEKAQWVAKERLEPWAAEYDESASHPWESWKNLWKHGLLSIGVPEEHGGLGLDMLTYCMVIESLARGCTSSSMTLHMHSVVQRFIDALATPEQKARFYPDVVDKGKLFGSWGSEPESRSGAIAIRETIITYEEGRYVLDGRKHFCTMAGAAHRFMVHCTMRGPKGQEGYQLALVPSDTPGVRITGQWNTLGMRATVSPSVSFEECPIDSDCLLGGPGTALKSGVGEGFGLGYAAVYLGAAQRALEFTVGYCKAHQFAPDPATLSHNLVVQRGVAEMTIALEGARLALYQSASRWEEADSGARLVLAARAKYLAAETALMATSKCLQMVGGRSAHKQMPLERLFRDVRTATLMPPNLDRSLELVGKAELGVKDDAFEARR